MTSRPITIVVALIACALLAPACPGRTPEPRAAPAPVDARAIVVGVWGVSTTSYEDAALRDDEVVRFGADGVMERGAVVAGRFVAAPGVGPSGPMFVMRYAVEDAGQAIAFSLDGAEERAALRVVDADRWETDSGPPEHVVVRYARRAH